jgi:AcrR family transcriptional regulator
MAPLAQRRVGQGRAEAGMVVSSRRRGKADSETRSLILDAAETLIVSGGYAAVSSRKIAAEANISFQLVHYYFHTMDDLFVALIERSVARSLERLEAIDRSDDPVAALWDMNSESHGAALVLQFMALAVHNEKIRTAIATFGGRFRERQVTIIKRYLGAEGGESQIHPAVVAVLLEFTARMMVFDKALGVSIGHAETSDFVVRMLARAKSGQASA